MILSPATCRYLLKPCSKAANTMGHQLLKEAPANEDQRKASLVLDSLQSRCSWSFSMFRRVSTSMLPMYMIIIVIISGG